MYCSGNNSKDLANSFPKWGHDSDLYTDLSGFHFENCPREGNWKNLDFKGT